MEKMSDQDKLFLEKFTNLDMLTMNKCGLKSLQNFPKADNIFKLGLNVN